MATKAKPAIDVGSKPLELSVAASSDNAYDTVLRLVATYESRLDKDHEVGLVTTAHPEGFYLTDIDCEPCGILVFVGCDTRDRPVMVLQDETQLSIEFVMLPKRLAGVRRVGSG